LGPVGHAVGCQPERAITFTRDEIGRLVPLRNYGGTQGMRKVPPAFLITRGLPVAQDDHPEA